MRSNNYSRLIRSTGTICIGRNRFVGLWLCWCGVSRCVYAGFLSLSLDFRHYLWYKSRWRPGICNATQYGFGVGRQSSSETISPFQSEAARAPATNNANVNRPPATESPTRTPTRTIAGKFTRSPSESMLYDIDNCPIAFPRGETECVLLEPYK